VAQFKVRGVLGVDNIMGTLEFKSRRVIETQTTRGSGESPCGGS
jgi:hypothetical protein